GMMVAVVAMWVHSYKDDAKHPQAWGVMLGDNLGYFIASHCGRVILAEHRVIPEAPDQSHWRIFVDGYGKFVAALPDGRHASESECYPSFFHQTPTKFP